MDEKYRKYLKSDEWAQLKIDLFELRGYSCEKCPNKKRLDVHHLTYENIYNEEPEDLIILCKKCHNKAHGIITKNKLPEGFNVLSLAQKVELKKQNPKKYKLYIKKLKKAYI